MLKKSKYYSPLQIIWLIFCKIGTLIFFKKSRIIRFPIFIRGKSSINFGKNLTTGYLCRLDALGEKGCLEFGNNVQLNDFVHIGATTKIRIGNNTLIASRVFISDHNHGNYSSSNPSTPNCEPNHRKLDSKPVFIGDNVWIGENVCILPGVTIGNGCIIGAGSIVNKSIPDASIAVGNPAKIIKKFDFQKKIWYKV